MMESLFLLLVAHPGALLEDKAPPSRPVLLLKNEAFYQKAQPEEVSLVGIIERTPTSGRIEPTARFHPFSIRYKDVGGKAGVRPLHVPEKAYLLADYLGKTVRLRGKVVEVKANGKTEQEFWPAQLEPLNTELANVPGPDGVYARCTWQPDAARRQGTRQYVFRNGEQLAEAMGIRGSSAATTATNLLAKRLGIPAIDWSKRMLVCISAGLRGPSVSRLTVTGVARQDRTVTIKYRLLPGDNTGVGYPAETVLLERMDAEVRFTQETKVTERK